MLSHFSRVWRFGWAAICLAAIGISVSAAESASATDATSDVTTPTHKQVRTIRPEIDGQGVSLHTFCLDGSGQLLCCVSPNAILVYTPDGVQQRRIDLTFAPTAVNVGADGTIVVAGEGKMARVSPEGKILLEASTPNIGDPAEFRKTAEEQARKRIDEMAKQYDEQLAELQKQVEKIEETPEEERTAIQKARLKAFSRQKELLGMQAASIRNRADQMNSDQVVAQASTVTGIATTDEFIFVCTRALEGYGYEVWRTDHQFQNGERVLDHLSGCCGQLDIQCAGDRLLIAENSRFRVRICSATGEDLSAFGHGDRTAPDGFGSCCNPMNLRCCEDGSILCAESSVGNIKRFSADGKFLGIVGKASIGGGCKHVAIGYDPKRNYHYMMNVDKNHVCVLVPLSEAPEFTEEELEAKTAREGLGKQLAGTWMIPGTKAKRTSGLSSFLSSVLGTGDVSSGNLFDSGTFDEDGSLKFQGGQFSRYGGTWSWAPVRQNTEKQELVISLLLDGIQYYDMRIVFSGQNEMQLTQIYEGLNASPIKYQRKTKSSESAPAETAATTN